MSDPQARFNEWREELRRQFHDLLGPGRGQLAHHHYARTCKAVAYFVEDERLYVRVPPYSWTIVTERYRHAFQRATWEVYGDEATVSFLRYGEDLPAAELELGGSA